MGTNRLRFFDLGTLNVYREDRRRLELRGSGLTENFLFKAQVGINIGPPLMGSQWEKIGAFHVTMNSKGHAELKRRRVPPLP